jgi:hypothetical protein
VGGEIPPAPRERLHETGGRVAAQREFMTPGALRLAR